MKYYVDQKICWDLKFFSVSKKDKQGVLSIWLTEGDYSEESIFGEIKEVDFPVVKLLLKNAPIRLVGKIIKVDYRSFQVEINQLQEIRDENGQIYFPQGSRESLLAFLESKILGAKIINIYDNYPSEDLLNLLEVSSHDAEIKILGKELSLDFIEKVKAFNVYFKRKIILKKANNSHARFYILDDEVFQVDSSLKNSGGDKATMIHRIEQSDLIKEDFEKWWSEAKMSI